MRPLRPLAAILLALTAASFWPNTADALPPYEVQRPEGRSRGVVQIIPGSGWRRVDAALVAEYRATARRFTSQGFTTLTHGYGPGFRGIIDVRAFHRRAKGLAGRRQPVCVWGASSGAHWGAMLASQFEVDCTIAAALPTLKVPGATPGSAVELQGLTRFFGPTQADRDRWSPATYAWNLRGPMLVGIGAQDPITPPANGEVMRAARPELVDFVTLARGSCDFVHAKVSCGELARFHRREAALLRRAVSRARRGVKASPIPPPSPDSVRPSQG
jgi:pimeloyl-ACP methyl ester carboxylesterase